MEIDVVSIEQGRAILKMQVRPDMMNGAGRLLWGILAVVADEAMALALCPLPAETEGIAPISESTSFIRWVLEVVILAEGHVIRKGRRLRSRKVKYSWIVMRGHCFPGPRQHLP